MDTYSICITLCINTALAFQMNNITYIVLYYINECCTIIYESDLIMLDKTVVINRARRVSISHNFFL